MGPERFKDSVESFRQKLNDFRNRPFDRAASRVAYVGTEVVPTLLLFGSVWRLGENLMGIRPFEQTIISFVYTGVSLFICGKLQGRILNEIEAHQATTPGNTPSTGGTF